MRYISIFLFFLLTGLVLTSYNAQGQSGPGGIGDATTNKLWLRADDIHLSDGDAIETWADTSGNDNDAVQSTGTYQPVFDSIADNGLPAVYFDGSDDLYENLFTITNEYITIYSVIARGNKNTNGPIYETAGNINSNNQGLFTNWSNRTYLAMSSGSEIFNPTPFNEGEYNIITAWHTNNDNKLFKNGSFINPSTNNNSELLIGEFNIGVRHNNNDYYKGDISELIFFNYPLDTVERIIVNNYLAAKYGISISNDKYDYDNNFGNDVAGIGQDVHGNSHTEAQSAKIFSVSDPTGLDDDEYLIFGHNDSSLAWSSEETPNAGYTQRMKREWRITRDNVGEVTVKLDTSLLQDKPANYTDYVVWIDRNYDGDDDFSTGSVEQHFLTLNNGQYEISGISFNDGDYVTFGVIRSVQLTETSGSGFESTASVSIEVEMQSSLAENDSIYYTVTGGTATLNTDYTITSPDTLVIPSGNTTANIQLSIIDDSDIEVDETIEITLQSSTPLPLGSRKVFTYTIRNNDYGSTGPAGVGSSSSNRLWLRADDLLNLGYSDGDPVNTWADTSGNENDAAAGSAPTFLEDTINDLPAIGFDGTNFFNNIFSFDQKNLTAFFVFNHNQDGTADESGALYQAGTSFSQASIFTPYYEDGKHYLFNGVGTGVPLIGDPSGFTQGSWYSGIAYHSTDTLELWRNGSLLNADNSTNNINPGQFRIGNANDSVGGFKGELAELIFYDFALNTAQKIIVSNYLTSKYQLGIAPAHDYYGYDQPADTFYHDLAGIGREDAANLHPFARSAGILQIGNPDDMDNGEYLLFAHNHDSINAWVSGGAPDGRRLKRIWRIDKTGDPGNVDLLLDTTLFPAKPAGISNYVAWIDTVDGNFSAGNFVQYPLKENNGSYEASSVSLKDGAYVMFGVINSLQFASTASSVSEATDTANIIVSVGASLGSDISVDYKVTDVSATNTSDFNLADGTLTIKAGETQDTIKVDIVNDTDVELEETFLITLYNSPSLSLGADTVHTVTINDNDNDGYVGPAGIGDSTNNILWIKADALTGLSDGDDVTIWPDTSGNDFDLIEDTDGSGDDIAAAPSYIASQGQINNLPVVRFDADVLLHKYSSGDFASSEITAVTVFKTSEAKDNDGLISYAAGGSNNEFLIFNSADERVYINNSDQASGVAFNDGDFHVQLVRWESAGGGPFELYKDGVGTAPSNLSGTPIDTDGTLTIGQEQDAEGGNYDPDQAFTGDYAEVILFKQRLNDAQVKIMNNYLSTKYGLTISNDLYDYDPEYYFDLAGIGSEGTGDLHTFAQSAKTLKISNAGDLESGEYLLFGHNGESAGSWTTDEAPNNGDNIQRIAREWQFDETGDVGSVTITVDTSLFASRPAEYTEFVVWIDSDGDFTSGATAYPLSQVGDTSEFEITGVSLSKGDYLTIGCIRPVVAFSSENTYAFEGEDDNEVTVEVSLNSSITSDVTVDYDTLAITSAALNDDYTFTKGSVTIPAGSTTREITFSIADDGNPENDEQVYLNLSSPSGASLGILDTAIVTIHDDDGARFIQFSESSADFNEGSGTAEVIVELDAANGSSTTADYILSGTAEGDGTDYTLSEGTATIPATLTKDTIFIPVDDDVFDEDNETIILRLINPSNASLGQNNVHTLSILDNDNPPNIYFQNTEDTVIENGGTLSMRVLLSEFSGKDVSFDYTISALDAQKDVDFSLSDSSITIPSGQYIYDIVATIIDDNIDENRYESFEITLSNATNGTIGNKNTFSAAIEDNDEVRFTGPGGVGNNENNILWLRTDYIDSLYNDAEDVYLWRDTSGNDNDLEQTDASERPTFEENEFNGFPTIRLNDGGSGDHEYLIRRPFNDFPTNRITSFIVYKTGGTNDGLLSYDVSNGNEYLYFNSSTSNIYLNGSNENSGINFADDVPNIHFVQWRNSDGALTLSKNGAVEGTGYYSSTRSGPIPGNGSLVLGQEQDGQDNIGSWDQDFNGDIAEVILFDGYLNSAEQVIIQNYLSSKYKISLDTNDYYRYDSLGGAELDTFYFDVSGIGKIDGNNFHSAARSAGILKIGNASDLGGNEFLLFGHNNCICTEWTDDEIPAGSGLKRIKRTWRVDETGEVGTVSLTVDTTLLPETPTGYNYYELLVENNNGDFSDGDVTRYSMTAQDSVFTVDGVNLSTGDYLTVAIKPTLIEFTDTSGSDNEGVSPLIFVELSEASPDTIRYSYELVSAGATLNTDFTYAFNDTLIIPPNVIKDTIQVSITNDGDEEANEDFQVVLKSADNAILGEDSVFTYNILDNDGLGWDGPGGVGSFSNQIDAWLETYETQDDLTDGVDIGTQGSATEWKDITGNNLDAYSEGNAPTFYDVTTSWDGIPVIKFEGDDEQDYLEIADNARMNDASGPQTERTLIAAFRTGNNISDRQVIFEEGGGTRGLNIYIENDSVRMGGWNFAENPWGYSGVKEKVETNTPYFAILQFDFDGKNGNDGIRGSLNGDTLGRLPDADALHPHAGDIGIGAMNNGACYEGADEAGDPTYCGGDASYFEGFIAEIISGNILYNEAQLKIVHNYLAAKYGSSLPSNDSLYDYGGTHKYEVFGIGQIDGLNSHNVAQGSGIIRIQDPSQMTDGNFMIIGHDDAAASPWSTDEVPGSGDNIRRMAREWRVDKQGGDLGTISLSIDSTDLDTLPDGFSEYVLMIDSDGDFTEGAEVYTLSLDTGYYSRDQVNFNKGDHFTIGIINPSVQFTATESSIDEDGGSIDVEVNLNYIPTSGFTVDFATSDSTAQFGQTPIADYDDSTGTLTIPADSSSATIALDVFNDGKGENDEYFKITLSNPSAGAALGDDSIHVVTIRDIDLDRQIYFEKTSSTISEDGGTEQIKVLLSKSHPEDDSTVSADVVVQAASTATGGGEDYSLLSAGSVEFSAGDTIEYIEFSVVDDVIKEDSAETVIFKLQNFYNANAGVVTEFTDSIIDNDTLPDVYFTTDTLTGKESVSPAQLKVQISSVTGQDVSVDYTVITDSSTAEGNSKDFTLSNGTLTIQAGDTIASINMNIFNDGSVESNETVFVRISNPQNAEMGATDTLVYIIIDDDGTGFIGPGGIGNFEDQIDAWLTTDFTDNLNDKDRIQDISTDKRWIDRTGNDIDAFQDEAAYQPLYYSQQKTWNGYPLIEFNGGEFLEIEDNDRMNNPSGPQSQRTIIVAFRTDADIENRQVIYEEGGGARGLNIYIEEDTLFIGGWNNADDDETTPWYYTSAKYEIQESTPYFAILQFDFHGATGEVKGILNGEEKILAGAGKLFPHGGDIGIGGPDGGACFDDRDGQTGDPGDCTDGDYYFDGFIAELISGNIVYNAPQLKIIQNYFAAKYNVNLPVGEDIYDYGNQYSNELFGIGQDSDTSHAEAQGSGIIKIENPTDLRNGKYMLIGHDGDSIEAWSDEEVPGASTSIKRVEREWRVDKQGGDLGSIDLLVDSSEFADLPAGFTNYIIMVDDDGDFEDGASVILLEDDTDYLRAAATYLSKGDYFTVGIIKPTVEFTNALGDENETGGTQDIEITLNFDANENIDVDFQTVELSGEATADADYESNSGTATISLGSRTTTIPITLLNDAIGENDEDFEIQLSNPTGGVELGADSIHTFTIHDDDRTRKVQFVSQVFGDAGGSHSESLDTVKIGLQITEDSPGDSTAVIYTILPEQSSASGDSADYQVPASDTVVFPQGSTAQDTIFLSIPIINDTIDENPENIFIQLSDPYNANLGNYQTYSDTILDDDPAPSVYFYFDSLKAVENVSPAEVPVVLSSYSEKTVTVDYEGFDGTALQGENYNLTNGTLTFEPGEDSLIISVEISPNDVADGSKDFFVKLSNDSNATILAEKDTFQYIIIDNDGQGWFGPGGVGSFGRIDAWHRTDDAVNLSNGNPVTSGSGAWQDRSPNNLDAFQTNSSFQPLFEDNLWNGVPIIKFEGGEMLEISDNAFMNNASGPQNKRTIIVPFRTSDNITNRQIIYEEGGGTRGLSIYIEGGNLYIGGWNKADDQGTSDPTTPWDSPIDGLGAADPQGETDPDDYIYISKSLSTNTPYLAMLQFDFDPDNPDLGAVYGYVNGELIDTLRGAGRLYPHGDDIGIGALNGGSCFHDPNDPGGVNMVCGGSGYNFNGYIAEFVSGNIVYNAAERKIVNNYFGAKYLINLPAGEDIYDYQDDYNFEVIGIGQETKSAYHPVAQGYGIVKLEYGTTGSEVNSGEYLMIGHNSGGEDFEGRTEWYDRTDNIDIPNNEENFIRIGQEYAVDVTGSMGTVNMGFIVDSLIEEYDYDKYVLMIDTNDDGADFTDSKLMYELSQTTDELGNEYYSVEDVLLNDNDFFTIGKTSPTIQFLNTTSDGFEYDSVAKIVVTLNYIPADDYSVQFSTADGTAEAGSDYQDTTGTFTIAAGQQQDTLYIPLINDADATENDEDFTVTLSSPESGLSLGDKTTHTFTIHDDDKDRKIQFLKADSTNSENITSIDIPVGLTESDAINPTKAVYEIYTSDTITGDTATRNADYVLLSDTITIAAGDADSSETFTLTITDDDFDENTEKLFIRLTSPENANIGDTNIFTYYIQDNDDVPDVSLNKSSANGIESSSALFYVKLSEQSGKKVTVNYAGYEITAQDSGIDFYLNDGELKSLEIPAGTDSVQLKIDIVDDQSDEPTDSLSIALKSATNANIVSPDSAVYVIFDNDGLGYEGPGGVGNNNQYHLWFRADKESYTDGQSATSFNDYSDNGNDGDGTGHAPTFDSLAINDRPAMDFGTTADNVYFDIADNEFMNDDDEAQNKRSLLAVFQTGTDINTRQVIFEEGGTGRGLNMYIYQDSLYVGGWNQVSGDEHEWGWSGATAKLETEKVYFAVMELDVNVQVDTAIRGYLNGTLMGENPDAGPLWPHGGDIRLGANESCDFHDIESSDAFPFGGKIMEFMSLNRTFNEAQRKIINNYYAAKYDSTIETSLPENLYTHGSSHGYEVFGIGRETGDNDHLLSQGDGIIRVEGQRDINDNTYMMFGHDDATINAWTDTSVALDSVYRLERSWRADKIGTIGSVKLAVDTSDFPTRPNSFYEAYILLVSPNADFKDGDERLYPLLFKDGSFIQSENEEDVVINDDDYFTIGVARNRTIKDGNWNADSVWLTGNVPGELETALISEGDTITVTQETEIGEVILANDAHLKLELPVNKKFVLNTGSFVLNGTASVDPGNQGEISYEAEGDQDVTSLTYHKLRFRGSGTKTLAGDITTQDFIYLNDDDVTVDVSTNDYTITVNGDWKNTGSTFLSRSGKVIFTGGGNHEVGNTGHREVFNDIVLASGNNLDVDHSIAVKDTLYMNGGIIDATHNAQDTLFIGTDDSNTGTLVREATDNYVIGHMAKWFNNGASADTFHVASPGNEYYRPLFMNFDNISNSGYVIASASETDPGDKGLSGLSVFEDGMYITDAFNDGYWLLDEEDFAFTTYSIEATANNFDNFTIAAGTRMITRSASGDDWALNGSHADAMGSVIKRTGVGIIPAQIGVGDTTDCSPATFSLSGNLAVCDGASGETYSIINTYHPSSTYTWTITNGTPAAGSGESETIDWTLGSSPYEIQIEEDNGCGTRTETFTVSIDPLPGNPGPISGNTPVNAGETHTYSVAPIADADTTIWTLPAGLTGSNHSQWSIDITFDAGLDGVYQISVVGQNGCDDSDTPETLDITVNSAPEQPAKPHVGPVDVCEGQQNVDYQTDSAARATSYEWDLHPGAAGILTANDTLVTVDFLDGYTGTARLKVRGANDAMVYGPWSDSLYITVNPKPGTDASASPTSVCYGNSITLDANPDGGGETYSWSPADSVGVGEETTEQPTYTPSANPGVPQYSFWFYVTVTNTDNCSEVDSVEVTTTRRPETGNQYYIPSDFDE